MEVSGRRAKGSDETTNVCDNCETLHSISRAAFGYCIDCREFLCEDCYNGHRGHKPCRNHKLLQGAQMPKQKLKPVDICDTHADEKIIYFCKEDKALACQKCAFLKHRLCKNVSDITTLSGDSKHNQRYRELAKQITFLESQADNTRQIRLQNLSKLDTNKKQAKADIKAFCKAMHEHLNKFESTMDEEVDAIGDEGKKKMDIILQECDSVSTELKVVATDLETNKDPTRKNELFIAIEKAAITMGELTEKLTTLSDDNSIREFKFEPDNRLKGVLTEVKTLGRLSIRSMTKVDPPQSAKAKAKPPLNLDTITAKTEDGINVRTQSDKSTCRITGSTMMDDDTTLAVADHDNDSVKLVDVRQKRVVSQIRLSDYPWDITRVKPDQLAVTLPTAQKVQFLSVTGTSLSLGREMDVSAACYGIDFNNDRLFISFTNPAQVQILSMSGSVLKTISAQTDTQIQFTRPFYLTLSVDRSLLYVSDYNTHIVYCLDMNGAVKATYKDQGLTWSTGVAAAEDGSLIVCDAFSHNLHVISSDCKQGRVLLDKSHGIQYPESVSYNSALSTLYVGQDDADTLKVFKLK